MLDAESIGRSGRGTIKIGRNVTEPTNLYVVSVSITKPDTATFATKREQELTGCPSFFAALVGIA